MAYLSSFAFDNAYMPIKNLNLNLIRENSGSDNRSELLSGAYYRISVNIGSGISISSGNGLMGDGIKSLPEPMLARSISLYGITWPQWVKILPY